MSNEKPVPPRWVFPWEPSSTLSAVDLDSLRYNLKRIGLPMEAGAALVSLHEKLPVAATNILNTLDGGRWVVAVGNNNRFLNALSILCPITYALTTLRTVYKVTTEQVVSWLKTRRPEDDWTQDPAGEYLHRVRKARLLVWHNATERISEPRLSGRITELIQHRATNGLPVLFTVHLVGESSKDANQAAVRMDTLDTMLAEGLGRGALNVVREEADFLELLLPMPAVKLKSVEL